MAQATVIVSNVSISVPNNINGVYVNVVTGVSGTTPASVPGYDFNVYGSSSLGLNFFTSTTGNGIVKTATGTAADLAAGTVISAGSLFATGVVAGDLFRPGGSHVLGFSFLNEITGVVNYGYARISTTTGTGGGAGFPATITQLVYENSGASVTVAGAATGAVPEPATWAMMVLGFGAIGFAVRRRTNVRTAIKFA